MIGEFVNRFWHVGRLNRGKLGPKVNDIPCTVHLLDFGGQAGVDDSEHGEQDKVLGGWGENLLGGQTFLATAIISKSAQ